MKNYIYKIVLLFLISINVFGQSPNWSVNENNYQYTMSFEGFINIDGKTLSSTNDKVAAFVNGECRGFANLLYVSSEDKYIAYLTVFSNVDNEIISFKVYDSANNVIRDLEKTKAFENNKHYGNLFQAYSFASPALSNNADILNFSFKNTNVNAITILGTQVTIFANKGIDLTALNAIFELSLGAKLFVGTENQTSGSNTIDFNKPVQFQVLSGDQSVVKQWTVVIKTDTATFYKKDAVCYAGGVIKVLYGENNSTTVLTKNGNTIATQNISNGETLFSNLEAGTYVVNIGGDSKEIIIKQKQ